MNAIHRLILSLFIFASFGCSPQETANGLTFSLSFPDELAEGPLTGRMFVCIAREDEREPRLQVGRYGVQVFGQDFENLSAGSPVEISNETLGYPIEWLKDLPKGTYFIQAVVSKYTEFERADGHTLWLHNDQWEGQNWRRSPGNLYSEVMKVTIDPSEERTIELIANNEIPPIEVPEDTEWVKRIKIQSDILTEFWRQPMYLGATILLPKGYEDNPDAFYPTIYQQGHFSLRPPMRFQDDAENELYQSWTSDDFPRFLAVTIQHPTPYFDDSYAVNGVNNGPYGDAIHQELIPKIEQEFRTISKSWARLLTGGSTGGWESFALQVLYPDFYGGTWSFAPDPLDFRNVEGINIYEDENAFYKQHEWYRVPTINTRNPETAEAVLTSEQRNRMELVNGTKGRSGQQLDIWSAVYGPIGDDGYFKPLFNKRTGEMDSTVAEYWRENFDLRYYLEKNWSEVGPKLVGKLNIITGHMDNFYLNQGVYHMEEFLESTKNPYYDGTVTYGPKQKGHRWRPYSQVDLIYKMAEHIEKNRPAGTLEKY